jgi:hypothetical protein
MKSEVILLTLPLAFGFVGLMIWSGVAETRSKKLGIRAVAWGLLAFVPSILGFTEKRPDREGYVAACGFLAVVLGFIAILLGLWAFVIRRDDRGTGTGYRVAALLGGLANLSIGSMLFVARDRAFPPALPAEETTWAWRSEQYGFELTVPSKGWKVKPNPNLVVEFRYPELRLFAGVGVGLPGRPDASYDSVLSYATFVKNDTPTSNTVERNGPNQHGHHHWAYMGEARNEKKEPYFFGISVTQLRQTTVLIMLEGQYQRLTEADRAEEARLIRAQAEQFLSSVK